MCYTQIILNNYEKMTKGGKVKNVRYQLYKHSKSLIMYTIYNYFKRFQATEFIIVPVVNPDGYQVRCAHNFKSIVRLLGYTYIYI